MGREKIAVLLHNVRSAHNVGAIFRTADGAGVEKMYLTGYTPAPTDRFGRAQKDIAKTALGAEKTVSWEKFASPARLLKRSRNTYCIVGVEQDARAKDYRDFVLSGPTLFIFGDEVKGITPSVLTACDEIVEIPMRGSKESLNVSVAAGIILFSFDVRKRRQ